MKNVFTLLLRLFLFFFAIKNFLNVGLKVTHDLEVKWQYLSLQKLRKVIQLQFLMWECDAVKHKLEITFRTVPTFFFIFFTSVGKICPGFRERMKKTRRGKC